MIRNWRPSFSILFFSILLVIVGLLFISKVKKMRAEAHKAKAMGNAKSLGIALTEFDSQYGGFPSLETKQLLIEEGIKVPDGETANAYLAQLLASKVLDSEKVFYVPGLDGTREADDIFNTPESTLARGENSFGYVTLMDGRSLTQSYGSSEIPVLVAPIISGGASPVFDQELFQGEALYLKLDSSVGTQRINEKGELFSNQTGESIFESGTSTLWGNDTPILRVPWFLE